ncbi:MAG: Gfo/Idh/MocA family oxidoreductase [Candidatus Firestonebacteria bacterium]
MPKVGIVGTGFIGGVHYGAYCKITGAEVVAICDLDTEKAKKMVKGEATGGNIQIESAKPVSFNPNDIKFYNKLENLIADKNIEIIDVCLPTYLHKDAVIKCARGGKNVLCEKPITTNLKDADEMIKVVKKAKIKFMVAHVIRFWPEYVVLKQIIDNKSLGKLLSMSFTRYSPTPTWTWNNWILNSKKSLSAALDLHIHDADFILYICGKPDKVASLGAKKVTKGVDHIITEYFYNKGPSVYAEGGFAFPEKFPFRMAFLALFEKGAIEYNCMNVPMTVYESGKEPIQPNLPEGDGYIREIQYFLKCVEQEKYPATVTPLDARESLRIILSEIKSVETGKPVVI